MAGGRKKNTKIVRYRRPLNIGVVFFGFIAVYLIVCIYMYFTSEHISGYEVIKGNLAADYRYTGIALRTEQVYTGICELLRGGRRKGIRAFHGLHSGRERKNV